MEKAKFEKLEKKTEKKEEKSELELKKEELKQKTEILETIPKQQNDLKENYHDGIEMQKIKKRLLELQFERPEPLNPYYAVEKTGEWLNLRKNEMKLRIKFEDKKLKNLEEELKNRTKSLNEQESRIKEELPRIKKKIEELEKTSSTIKTK